MNLIKNKQNELYSGYKLILFFMMYMLMASFFIYVGINTLLLYHPIYHLNSLLFDKIISVLSLILTLWLVCLIEKRTKTDFGIHFTSKSYKELFLGLLFGALSIIVIAVILFLTKNAKLTYGVNQPQLSISHLYMLLLFIMVGIDEELLVRGYFVHTLNRYNKKWIVYIVPALIFSALHLLNPNVSKLGLFNIVFVGFLFTYMTLKTKNIMMAIGYHIAWNYFQGSVLGFNVSGMAFDSIFPVTIINNNLLTGGGFGLEGGILTTIILFTMILLVSRIKSQ